MPTPLEILLDPVSLAVLAIYGALVLVEALFPARELPRIPGWHARALVVFAVYFFLSSYLPLLWADALAPFRLLDLESVHPLLGAVVGVLVFELLVYVWHRAMHRHHWLWRAFHQMHHSAERVDSFGAFYFSPLDIAGFALLSSLTLTVVGLPAQSVTWYLYVTMFLATFQHTNIRTPQWLGYIVQRHPPLQLLGPAAVRPHLRHLPQPEGLRRRERVRRGFLGADPRHARLPRRGGSRL
jgi:sterol desaturase/sphingolipid hydroxylase (fatty acid hydroxylase superfamily)